MLFSQVLDNLFQYYNLNSKIDSEIDKLEQHFNSIELPNELDLINYTLYKVPEFIKANIEIIRNSTKEDAKPFIKRLNDIKEVLN